MDRTTGDGADSAEDSGSSQSYPSTLPGIPKAWNFFSCIIWMHWGNVMLFGGFNWVNLSYL